MLKDVCGVLDISNSRNISARLDDDEKGVYLMDTPGGAQNMTIISESGLYATIMRSDKPQAKPFRKWVTSEVLPAIRKHGMYAIDDVLNDPDMPINALLELKEERAKQRHWNRQLQYKHSRLQNCSQRQATMIRFWNARIWSPFP